MMTRFERAIFAAALIVVAVCFSLAPLTLARASAPQDGCKPGPDFILYPAHVLSVYDADTLRADIETYFEFMLLDQPLRLLCIDAPEMRGLEREAGIAARDWLRARLEGKTVVIATRHERGKYGRYLVIVFADGENINEALVAAGHAGWAEY